MLVRIYRNETLAIKLVNSRLSHCALPRVRNPFCPRKQCHRKNTIYNGRMYSTFYSISTGIYNVIYNALELCTRIHICVIEIDVTAAFSYSE